MSFFKKKYIIFPWRHLFSEMNNKNKIDICGLSQDEELYPSATGGVTLDSDGAIIKLM